MLGNNIPDQAVFLNGFNDFYYSAGGADGIVPFFDEVLKLSQDGEFRQTALSEIVNLIPNYSKENSKFTDSYFSSEFIANCLSNIRSRYQSAVAIQNYVGNCFGVKIQRFIEPNQSLNCRADQKLLPRVSDLNQRLKLVGYLYKEIENIGLKDVFGNSAVSLLDINQDRQSFPLYLDGVHCSPVMNELIAVNMSKFIGLKRKLWNRKEIGHAISPTVTDELLNPDNYPLF